RARLALRRPEAGHGRQARVGVVGTVLERVGAVGEERSSPRAPRLLGAETERAHVRPVALLRRYAGRWREPAPERNEYVEVEVPRVVLQIRRHLDAVCHCGPERRGAPAERIALDIL